MHSPNFFRNILAVMAVIKTGTPCIIVLIVLFVTDLPNFNFGNPPCLSNFRIVDSGIHIRYSVVVTFPVFLIFNPKYQRKFQRLFLFKREN
jgi:hypothetical protein